MMPARRACSLCGAPDPADPAEPTDPEIRAAWLTHRVLAFGGQRLTDDELERFARRFGPPGDDPFFESIEGHPYIAALHRLADETASIFAERNSDATSTSQLIPASSSSQ